MVLAEHLTTVAVLGEYSIILFAEDEKNLESGDKDHATLAIHWVCNSRVGGAGHVWTAAGAGRGQEGWRVGIRSRQADRDDRQGRRAGVGRPAQCAVHTRSRANRPTQ